MNQHPSAMLRSGLRWTDNDAKATGRRLPETRTAKPVKRTRSASELETETKHGSSELFVNTAIR